MKSEGHEKKRWQAIKRKEEEIGPRRKKIYCINDEGMRMMEETLIIRKQGCGDNTETENKKEIIFSFFFLLLLPFCLLSEVTLTKF